MIAGVASTQYCEYIFGTVHFIVHKVVMVSRLLSVIVII